MKNRVNTKGNNYLTTAEVAAMLGISRIAIFNKIKQGKIKARKIGKRYLIPKSEFDTVFSGTALSSRQKRLIELGVKKTVNEYGEALKLLGQE